MYDSFVSVCLTNVNNIYIYVIKIDESWRLKLISTCQLFYDYIVDEKSPNFSLSFVSEIHDYDTIST